MKQHYDLKALANKVLEHNKPCNTGATEWQQPLHDTEPIKSKFEFVTCESCKHIIHSVLNPGAGWGQCKISPKQGDYPRRRHICQDHEPP